MLSLLQSSPQDQHRVVFPNQCQFLIKNSRLNSFIQSYADSFANFKLGLGRTFVIQHEIDTCDVRAIKQPPYRVSQEHREEIDKHITKLLEQDRIRVSSSPWSSPVAFW